MGYGGKGKFRFQGKGKGKGYGSYGGYRAKGGASSHRAAPYEPSPLSGLGHFCQRAVETALCRTFEAVVSDGFQTVAERMFTPVTTPTGPGGGADDKGSRESKAGSSLTRAVLDVFMGTGDKTSVPKPTNTVEACPVAKKAAEADQSESAVLFREMLDQQKQTLNILATVVGHGGTEPQGMDESETSAQVAAMKSQMSELQAALAAAKAQMPTQAPTQTGTAAGTMPLDATPKELRQSTLSFVAAKNTGNN